MIETPALRVRALAMRDLALFGKLYADAESMRHIGRELKPREVAPCFRATFAAARSRRGPWFFAIIDKRRGRGIGLCSVRHFSPRQRHAEVGMMLLPEARRHGFATAALGALIDAAFKALPIDAVWVQYRRANLPAARLCDALGFAGDAGWRPRGADARQCVREIRQSGSQTSSDQSDRGHSMSKLVGILEQAGADAAMRHANRDALLRMMQQEPALEPGGVQREKMYCLLLPVKTPKKAPKKKQPVKAPPKKKPAKKAPAKATPAKRKR